MSVSLDAPELGAVLLPLLEELELGLDGAAGLGVLEPEALEELDLSLSVDEGEVDIEPEAEPDAEPDGDAG